MTFLIKNPDYWTIIKVCWPWILALILGFIIFSEWANRTPEERFNRRANRRLDTFFWPDNHPIQEYADNFFVNEIPLDQREFYLDLMIQRRDCWVDNGMPVDRISFFTRYWPAEVEEAKRKCEDFRDLLDDKGRQEYWDSLTPEEKYHFYTQMILVDIKLDGKPMVELRPDHQAFWQKGGITFYSYPTPQEEG